MRKRRAEFFYKPVVYKRTERAAAVIALPLTAKEIPDM